MSVLPAVGYTDPDQSHFTSRHYWEVGATQADLLTGWMGRYLDLARQPRQSSAGPVPWTRRYKPALATARMPVAAIDPPSLLLLLRAEVCGGAATVRSCTTTSTRSGASGPARATRRSVGQGGTDVESTLRKQLLPFQPAAGASAPGYTRGYQCLPDAFPMRMAGIAQLLAAGLPLRCVSISTESVFDTHDNQVTSLGTGLGEAAQTLYAFQRDLEARGLADRVLTLVWSEFGRRPQENASGGTDHGAAGWAL